MSRLSMVRVHTKGDDDGGEIIRHTLQKAAKTSPKKMDGILRFELIGDVESSSKLSASSTKPSTRPKRKSARVDSLRMKTVELNEQLHSTEEKDEVTDCTSDIDAKILPIAEEVRTLPDLINEAEAPSAVEEEACANDDEDILRVDTPAVGAELEGKKSRKKKGKKTLSKKMKLEAMKEQKKKKKKKRKRKIVEVASEEAESRFVNEVYLNKCNRNIVSVRPVLSKDSKFVFCSCGNMVGVYRRATGLLDTTFTAHTSDVVSLHVNQVNPLEVISTSSSGEVIFWEYSDCSIKKRYQLPMQVLDLILDPQIPSTVYCVAYDQHKKKSAAPKQELFTFCKREKLARPEYVITKEEVSNGEVEVFHARVNYHRGVALSGEVGLASVREARQCAAHNALEQLGIAKKEDTEFADNKKLMVYRVPLDDLSQQTEVGVIGAASKSLAVSKSGKSIAILNGSEMTYHYKRKSSNTEAVLKYDDSPLTCVAFHPMTDGIVATGNQNGNIVVWHGLPQKPVSVKHHWHPNAVADIAFAADGLQLMSGGFESTLVTWQLETQNRSFLPRLGAPIQHLTQCDDGQMVCVSLSNNVVKIISTIDSKLTVGIKCLAPVPLSGSKLAYSPQSDTIVMNSLPLGSIQFYKPDRDQVTLTLDVVGENEVAAVDGRATHPTIITMVEFSLDGCWMAVVEYRHDPLLSDEWRLKFWSRVDDDNRYTLRTVVDPVHHSEVTSLQFHPNSQKCVTTSSDGIFKLWLCEQGGKKDNTTDSWDCEAARSYHDAPCGDSSFSHDGSLLATVFQAEMAVWETEPLSLRTVLGTDVMQEDIKAVAFGKCESANYLIAHTEHYVIVWDASTFSKIWCCQTEAHVLAVDPFTRYFVLFAISTSGRDHLDVHVMDPARQQPLKSLHKIASKSLVASVAFRPTSTDDSEVSKISGQREISNLISELYILSNESDIWRFGKRVKTEPAITEQQRVGTDKLATTSAGDEFGDLFRLKQAATASAAADHRISNRAPAQENQMRALMSTPSHLLPDMEVLCRALTDIWLADECANDEKEEPEDESMMGLTGDDSDDDDIEDDHKETVDTTCENDVVSTDVDWSKITIPNINFNFQKNVFDDDSEN